jgi:hypothetical protein
VNGFNNLENENPSNVPMTVEARDLSDFCDPETSPEKDLDGYQGKW